MNETIFIVTAGCYSDYHIEAIFKDKEKAEFYCSCHYGCLIEEYEFCDDEIFTPFNAVQIYFRIRTNGKCEMNFRFVRRTEEDEFYFNENKDNVSVYDDEDIRISLVRRLPNNYDEEKIKQKYTKVYQDLRAEILYLVSESDCSTYESRKVVEKNIEQYIAGRFGIEVEDN